MRGTSPGDHHPAPVPGCHGGARRPQAPRQVCPTRESRLALLCSVSSAGKCGIGALGKSVPFLAADTSPKGCPLVQYTSRDFVSGTVARLEAIPAPHLRQHVSPGDPLQGRFRLRSRSTSTPSATLSGSGRAVHQGSRCYCSSEACQLPPNPLQ
jgi:hypothetical protein